jgi:ketosteroid isomerase-like protein
MLQPPIVAHAILPRSLGRTRFSTNRSVQSSQGVVAVDQATTYAEVVEGIRATIAAYTHALDDGRTDDVVATYCPDGVFELAGTGTFEGHEALRETYGAWTPRKPQRHLVVNTLVSDWNAHEATATSDVVLIVEGREGWAVQFVARYRDLLHHVDGTWKFHRRTVA